MYSQIKICMYVLTHACVHVYMYVCMQKSMCTCMYVTKHVSMHACVHTYMYVCIQTTWFIKPPKTTLHGFHHCSRDLYSKPENSLNHA